MEIRPWSAPKPGALDLSKAPSFLLGPIAVEPSLRTIGSEGKSETLEPRVMRALVALADAKGAVLSREDLIAQCWDGVIVGDNAINRVLSLLRRTLHELSNGSVHLDTITKVGFRLIVDDDHPLAPAPNETDRAQISLPPSRRFGIGRREMLAGGGILALATIGAGGLYALRGTAHQADPRAVQLAAKAELLTKSGLPGSTRQATRFLEMAVEIDPQYALGWGRLAAMYRHSFEGFSKGERESFPRLVHTAAQRALALESGQPDARLALAVMHPFTGRWAEAETELRDIQRKFPDNWYANAQLSLLLTEVGRHEEALVFRRKVIEIDNAIPVAWGLLSRNLLLANRPHEADRAIKNALDTWPNHGFLWFEQFGILLETERPAEAASFARDTSRHPDIFPPDGAEKPAGIADAIVSRDPAVKAAKIEHILAGLNHPDMIPFAAPALAHLGNGELAMQALSAYFLGGRFLEREWAKPDGFEYRTSSLLYLPSLLALRNSRQHATILRDIGLEDYWNKSGSQPDFRRV